MLRSVALVRTDVSEECSASIVKVTRIGELGTLAITSNWRTLRRNFPQENSCSLHAGYQIQERLLIILRCFSKKKGNFPKIKSLSFVFSWQLQFLLF
jgi:hypothetical protein